MFKDLYRRLTVMNALLLIAFLMIFSYSIVGFTNSTFDASAKKALINKTVQIQQVVNQNGTLEFTLPNEGSWLDNNVQNEYTQIDYMIWDDQLRLVNLSHLREDLLDQAYLQAERTLARKDVQFSTLYMGEAKFRVYNTYATQMDGSPYVIQVYQSRAIDDLVTRQIFLIVMGIGSVSLLFLILISAHMAKKSLEPVRIAYERQKEFIADASHELRTPLTIIRTTAELLSMKDQETIAENARWLNNITGETETMSRMIENLLILAQADNNQIPVIMGKVDVTSLVKNVGDKFQPVAKDNQLQLESILSENVHMIADKDKLNQLLMILVDNAIKYTAPGGSVTLSLMHTADKVIISVKDTGVGMALEEQERVFERFYRVDKARSREQGGSGLGLSIARWIVEEHRGKIRVDSLPDRGSTFTVELPKNEKAYRKW
jgi:signal transduction histidine kinase